MEGIMKTNRVETPKDGNSILKEDVLEGIRAVLIEERKMDFRHIEEILKSTPIMQPPVGLNTSSVTYREVHMRPPRARHILSVLKGAASMYGPSATFGECRIRDLYAEWMHYCDTLQHA